MNPPALKSLLLIALALPLFAAAGCDKKELTTKDEKDLRNNFTRALTPEEIARMNAAPSAGSKKK